MAPSTRAATSTPTPHDPDERTNGSIGIVGTEVNDAGLTHLKNLPDLRELILYREHFTEAGMAHLKDVKLRAVPKLPDYTINNDDMKKWQQEPALISMMYDSITPLDIMMQYPPAD